MFERVSALRRITRYLADDEEVLFEARRHAIVLARPLVVTALVIVAASVVGFVVTPDATTDFLDTVLGGLAVLVAFRFGWKVRQWRAQRIFLTDRRIFELSGTFGRRLTTTPLVQIVEVVYRRPLLGRLLGYGTVALETVSAGGAGDPGARLITLERLAGSGHLYRTLTSLLAPRVREPAMQSNPTIVPADDEDTGRLPPVIV